MSKVTITIAGIKSKENVVGINCNSKGYYTATDLTGKYIKGSCSKSVLIPLVSRADVLEHEITKLVEAEAKVYKEHKLTKVAKLRYLAEDKLKYLAQLDLINFLVGWVKHNEEKDINLAIEAEELRSRVSEASTAEEAVDMLKQALNLAMRVA